MTKMISMLVLSTLRKHVTGSVVKNFVESYMNTVLTAACYQPSSDSISAQKFVSVSAELNQNRSQWVLVSDKNVGCHLRSS